MQTALTVTSLAGNRNFCFSPNSLSRSTSTFIHAPLNSTSTSNLTLNSPVKHGREHLLGELNPQCEKSCRNVSSLLLHYANNGLFAEAQSLCDEILYSSFFAPTSNSNIDLDLVSSLIQCYAQMNRFEDILPIIDDITLRNRTDNEISRSVYSLAVSCFGKAGLLKLMEETLYKMTSKGLKIDSFTGNTFVKYYSCHGSISDMEYVYQRLKKSQISVEKDTIRVMASKYIGERKYFKLGEFVKDVGLGRLNVGNLLWNLLLLSYAVNFKMKTLQREFLNMLDNGFKPDLNTFNVRALAFSKMCMFWDLHLSVNHMKSERVGPDLVMYGCFVDAYLERRLGRNLPFALEKMGMGRVPVVRTDPLVFEAFGKGDFHTSSEILLESVKNKRWSYAELVRIYLKKRYRSNQIFWNY
ncbi:pentatricopeptide repeat-containing protein At3g42630-like isoform X3 [Carex rostrata]